MKEELIRLNKFLSEAGVCSRREADRLIEAGKVFVDGRRAETGMKVSPNQEVKVGKKVVSKGNEMVLLAVNKPMGIVCTEEKKEKNNIIRFLNYPTRVTYIGRLDKDSEGLLLMTNNGDIINKMMRAGNRHEKEYKVTVNKPVTREFIEKMGQGVPILDTVTRLERVRVMNIELGNLKSGEYRKVTDAEIKELYELIKDSSNETVIEQELRHDR